MCVCVFVCVCVCVCVCVYIDLYSIIVSLYYNLEEIIEVSCIIVLQPGNDPG